MKKMTKPGGKWSKETNVCRKKGTIVQKANDKMYHLTHN